MHRQPLLLILGVIAACEVHQPQDARPFVRLTAADTLAIIGGDDERDGYAIGSLRAAVLMGERIVIADGLGGEIRFYDTAGSLIHRYGRTGSGPGEFRALRDIARATDTSVVAWDVQLQRLTFVSEARVSVVVPQLADMEAWFPQFVGVLASGEIVFRDEPALMGMRGLPTGLRRDSVSYHFLAPDGTPLSTIRVEGDETWFINEGTRWTKEPLIFGSQVVQTITDHGLIIGETGIFRFEVANPASRYVVYDAVVPSAPLSSEAVQAERTRRMAEARKERTALPIIVADGRRLDPSSFATTVIERAPVAKNAPAYSELLGAGERFWYCSVRETQRQCKEVRDGLEGATVQLPATWRVLAFGERTVLVSVSDHLDRAAVLLLELRTVQ
jgi:hypothetical protein